MTSATYKIALVSKSLDNPFWQHAHQACHDKTREIVDIECIVTSPEFEAEDPEGLGQASIIDDLVQNRAVDGIAVAVRNIDSVAPAINRAVEAGIRVVTLDSDAPESLRSAYIGTDNYFFGQQIAKVLKQLQPNGGTYAAIADTPPNLAERLRGFQDEIKSDKHWIEAQGSPAMYKGNATLAVQEMHRFASQGITNIVPVMGAAMRSGGWEEFVYKYGKSNLTLVSGDAMPNQLEFLARGLAHGLVGQLPYEMGAKSIQSLYALLNGEELESEIIGTNVLSHILVPLILPEHVVDHNLIGNLHTVGYTLFGIIAFISYWFSAWTCKMHDSAIVKAAQPAFLAMILLGVMLMAATILPLSFDDNGEPDQQSERSGFFICMSTPWLGFLGFSIAFSALFAKTMRVNRIFHSTERQTTVTFHDVMYPFLVLLTGNIIILALWTILDPLVYTREELPGTDGWNRVIATYGSCQSDHPSWFLIPLAIVNLGVLVLANWQAYEARHIVETFADTKYIGLIMSSLLQAILIGVPILFFLRESPQAFYLLLVFMIFVICAAIVILVFVPKLFLVNTFNHHTQEQQSRVLRKCVRFSQENIRANRSSDSFDMTNLASKHDLFVPHHPSCLRSNSCGRPTGGRTQQIDGKLSDLSHSLDFSSTSTTEEVASHAMALHRDAQPTYSMEECHPNHCRNTGRTRSYLFEKDKPSNITTNCHDVGELESFSELTTDRSSSNCSNRSSLFVPHDCLTMATIPEQEEMTVLDETP